jgi:hypothetical protein
MSRAQANAAELRASQYGGSDVAANVYAMHNLGTGDGPRFLEALRDHPDAPVGSVLSDRVISGIGR